MIVRGNASAVPRAVPRGSVGFGESTRHASSPASKKQPGCGDHCAGLRTLLAALLVCASGLVSVAAGDDAAPKPSQVDGKLPPLVFCAVPDSLPRTGKSKDGAAQGLDVAVARLVAKELGREVEFHWCVSAACSWNCVRDGRCEIVIGQPQGSGPERDLAWTAPYSGSRFGLVVHNGTQGLRSHADLAGKRVGVVTGSVALSAAGHTLVEFKTREELLDQFVASRLDAAFVDDDFAAWHLHTHPELPLQRVPEYVPRERWNMAFAVRSKDANLLRDLNRALTQVLANGHVSKAFADQGVGYRAPFTEAERKPAVVNSWKRIRETGELVVGMDPANLPYSAAKGERPGCDVELAQALARELNLKLRIDWIDVQRETALGQLLDNECDLAFGAAIEPRAVDDEEEIADRVLYSRPYYGTGYVLVTRKEGPAAKSLAELKGEKSRRIGAEAGSVADYQLRQRGYLRRLFRTQLSVLKSLHDGGIDYAYLWANAGWTLHTSPELQVELAPGYVPEDHWNIAVALRRGDNELKTHVDAALQKLIDDGTVARTLTAYHVPAFPVFAADDAEKRAAEPVAPPAEKPANNAPAAPADKNQSALRIQPAADGDGIIRHPPPVRGPEPQMQRRQRSKELYGGLARVRSAGVLVVGLDHNSLPFSSVHPEPAGLDYDIARLVAEKLGVTLKIYWAYSSHDSYPSKLAAKELCDVMLGVMPDDRFGKRVAFTKPYYAIDYRYVVAADDVPQGASPFASLPIARERGVALRGLADRDVRDYASLENILEAVASGTERAGYVSAARGSWLAEQRWPGKLKFIVPDTGSADRFPICAAVRKSEPDLSAAIDTELDDLARTGKLAEVFARWHIPYEAAANAARTTDHTDDTNVTDKKRNIR